MAEQVTGLNGSKLIFIGSSLFFTSITQAALDCSSIISHPCKVEVSSLMQEWKSRQEWREETISENQMCLSPTNTIGVWITATEYNQQLQVSRQTRHTRLTATWNSQCGISLENLEIHRPESAKKSVLKFTDKNLANLASQKKSKILYFYSPNMYLSLQGIEFIRDVAKQLQIELILIRDSEEPEKKLSKSFVRHFDLSKEDQLILDSLELRLRGVGVHAPTLIVLNKFGKFSSSYPGLKDKSEYMIFVKNFLK